MFIAHIGSDGLIHRVATAMFSGKEASGTAFCNVQGEVKFSESDVITCDKCRATIIRSISKDLSVKGQKAV